MGQIIQEWTKKKLWKIAFWKFELIMVYLNISNGLNNFETILHKDYLQIIIR